MIGNKISSNISFKSNSDFAEKWAKIPSLDTNYTTPESRMNTVATIGSSRTTPQILKDMDATSPVIREIIQSGKNINSGCGEGGMMGVFYNTAYNYSKRENGIPVQNLAIVMDPPWGDENIDNCIPIGKATSEIDRIDKFMRSSDNFLAEKGGVSTLQEMAQVVGENKNIVFADKKFYIGLSEQYTRMYKDNLLPYAPEETFLRTDNKDIKGILDKINNPLPKLAQSASNLPLAIKELSDRYLVYKGDKRTLNAAISLVQHNEYPNKGEFTKPVVFVGDFFNGIKKQYQAIADAGLFKHKPSELCGFITTAEAKKFGKLM